MPSYEPLDSFDTFLAIIARLRAPDGCPWDKEQTHASLKRFLVEECHEVLDAIDGGDPQKIAEELGDVLLQVGLHAQIARDDGRFAIGDVLGHINAKLLRRHPHVFGDVRVSGSADVVANWEKLKQEERGAPPESLLDGVPKSLPALARSQELQARAAKTGFDWPDISGVLAKVHEEIGEFQRARTPAEQEHELGDIFAALVNIGRKLGIDSEGAARKANGRFTQRFQYMERAARDRGAALSALSLDQQEALWQEAKRHTA
ncbi:MAG: nucleoside triphosphate pyrophosphohydrolase [Dehalococcoidia bacterium]|nr:nucleoside triphosphate pyrophosphohydrolase [Dehalococcoidia bacterium]